MKELHAIKVPTPFPIGPVNVYLLGGSEPTLVDAGPNTAEALEVLRAGLMALGYTLADIRHMVITHAHPDHYGLAARIVAESGSRVYSHRYNHALLLDDEAETRRRNVYYARALRQAGIPSLVLDEIRRGFSSAAQYSQPVAVEVPLDGGESLKLGSSTWEVIHTPGHAGGHICLYHQPSGYLLSGDHLLRDISSNPVLEPPLPGEKKRPRSLVQYLRALARVAALEVAVAFPGHGAPITDPRELIERRIRFHRHRVGEIATVLIDGPLTAFQIATLIFSGFRGVEVFLAVSEVIGHLDILEGEERVASQLSDDVVLYSLTN